MHIATAAAARRVADSLPAAYPIFHPLHPGGRALLDVPYPGRRGVLDELELAGPSWQTPPVFEGDGASAVAASKQQGLEGVLAKRLESRYAPGRRTRDWIKVKNIAMQEVVIGGWRPGQGRRSGTIGSLLLGIPADEGLHYVGQVGTGFTAA